MTKFPMSISVSAHTQWFHQNEFQMLSRYFGVLVRWEEREREDEGVNEISVEGWALLLPSLPL